MPSPRLQRMLASLKIGTSSSSADTQTQVTYQAFFSDILTS